MRVNIGIRPIHLCDNHLIAEHVELLFVPGILLKRDFKIINKIPEQFSLGIGHISFFYNKILYLKNRLNCVCEEMKRRGFKTSSTINVDMFPKILCNNWNPTINDSMIIRNRIEEKMLRKPFKFWRYERKYVANIQNFIYNIKNSSLNKY